jgi:hypothetical protein
VGSANGRPVDRPDGGAPSPLDRTRAAYAWQLRLASADLDAWLADVEGLVATVLDDGQALQPGHLASARAAYVQSVRRELCSPDARLDELARLSAWLVGAALSERGASPSSATPPRPPAAADTRAARGSRPLAAGSGVPGASRKT